MTLASALRGDRLVIELIPSPLIRAQLIRFGLGEGSVVRLLEKLPAGPVVLSKGHQEIAIGRRLSETISVHRV